MLTAKTQILIEKRIEMGWSQAELARKSGLNPGLICRAERGKGVSAKTVKAVSDAFSVPIKELFIISASREV